MFRAVAPRGSADESRQQEGKFFGAQLAGDGRFMLRACVGCQPQTFGGANRRAGACIDRRTWLRHSESHRESSRSRYARSGGQIQERVSGTIRLYTIAIRCQLRSSARFRPNRRRHCTALKRCVLTSFPIFVLKERVVQSLDSGRAFVHNLDTTFQFWWPRPRPSTPLL